MKKILFLLIATGYLLLASHVDALTPTAAPTKTTAEEITNSQINALKDRIASRVAELKLVEKRGIIGTVSEVNQTQLTLSDLSGQTRFVDVDELTQFSSPSAKGSFGISDITKGTKISVVGLFNKESRRILGRFIDVISLSQTVRGGIATVDRDNFTVTVQTESGNSMLVDIETTTRILSYGIDDGLTRSGFSKMLPGNRVIVIGFPNIKEKNRLTASRILLFPTFGLNPKIQIQAALPIEESPTPTGTRRVTPAVR